MSLRTPTSRVPTSKAWSRRARPSISRTRHHVRVHASVTVSPRSVMRALPEVWKGLLDGLRRDSLFGEAFRNFELTVRSYVLLQLHFACTFLVGCMLGKRSEIV